MDVDSLAAEKAQRQAELAAADYNDYGDDVEYTAQEWLDWEASLQEELNWLGAKGKDGGKGRKGKGKGKGKNKGKGKGSANCGWCDKPGHWKAECREFKKWKDDRDAERKKNGEPAFVPRVRGVHSLEAESPPQVPLCEECQDEEHDDYEMTGLMQESDDEGIDCLDRFDKDDGEEDTEDNDYVWHGSREVPPPADEAGGAEIREATTSDIDETRNVLSGFGTRRSKASGILQIGLRGSTQALDILPADSRQTRVPNLIKFYDLLYTRFSEAPVVACPFIKGVEAGESSHLSSAPSQREDSSFVWRTIQKPQTQQGASEVHGDTCSRLGQVPLCQ